MLFSIKIERTYQVYFFQHTDITYILQFEHSKRQTEVCSDAQCYFNKVNFLKNPRELIKYYLVKAVSSITYNSKLKQNLQWSI